MTPTEISDLVYAVVGVLGALTLWLRIQSAHKQIAAIKKDEPKL